MTGHRTGPGPGEPADSDDPVTGGPGEEGQNVGGGRGPGNGRAAPGARGAGEGHGTGDDHDAGNDAGTGHDHGIRSGSGPDLGQPGDSFQVPDADLTPWQRYVLLLRALDAERRIEEEHTSGSREDSRTLTEDLERLGPEVIEQGAELGELAVRLRLHRPRLTPATIADPPPPAEVARVAAAAMHRSDNAARQALVEASRPGFLPNWPPRFRNAVIYLGWALPAVLLQWALVSGGSSALLVLLLVPTVAFLGGLYTAGAAGRVRLSRDRVERSPRLGAAITYGAFPLVFVYTVIRSLFS
ncbi:MAG: hypothetical protein P8Z68_01615 [Kineosporiaceae bacterium]|jgi:hypothetical protein